MADCNRNGYSAKVSLVRKGSLGSWVPSCQVAADSSGRLWIMPQIKGLSTDFSHFSQFSQPTLTYIRGIWMDLVPTLFQIFEHFQKFSSGLWEPTPTFGKINSTLGRVAQVLCAHP